MKVKMKTHKSGAKRYRATGTGKIVRGQAGRGHLNAKKSSSRKRRLEGWIGVHPTNLDKISLEIPYIKSIR